MEYNLRPLWTAILEVYKEVYQICKRHNLRIYVFAGTEIGAMRHHGFIPWDDDFDVLMPRPDYERFIKYAKEELPARLDWISIETDTNYPFLFGKVCDTRVDIIEKLKGSRTIPVFEGVFVDVFPMDGLPSSKIGIFMWNIVRSFLRRVVKADAKMLDRFMKFFNYDKCENVGWCLSTFRYPKYVYKKSWFDAMRMVPFEDIEVPVPIGVEEHLNHLYGDYRQLPPESERVPTHQEADCQG